ncbi:MAG: 16S rRNA (guanine(966)-N(2))-methyltransferase RsmD [Granulosicoccus sp.]
MASSFRPARKSEKGLHRKAPGQVRIIAGRWRGRKLDVANVAGLRPTGDRVRETLFNWLQAEVAGARCLDLFAGTGALGFEALSRAARMVTFVEPDMVAFRHLRQSCDLLDISVTDEAGHTMEETASMAHLYAGTAQAAVEHCLRLESVPRYDLVFIDPPFQMNCQWAVLQDLVPGLLSDRAHIYIESPFRQAVPETVPAGCEIVREKRFGDVAARVLSYTMVR